MESRTRPAALPPTRHAWRLGSAALLAAAVVLTFSGALRNGWVQLDDPVYVFDNPHIRSGVTLEGLRWSLHMPHGGNWHPLTSLLHMLDAQVFGLKPAGHHATSIALHLVNAVLLVFVLARLTGSWWRSLLLSALFALHPLRVESVAWISERKDVASGLFFLLAIDAYRRWAARPNAGRYAMVVVLLALGLMAKPMLVTLPFVLVLLDVWPLGRLAGGPRAVMTAGAGPAPSRSLRGLALEKWPLLLLAAGSSVATLIVQHAEGAVASLGTIPLERRVCNALITVWRYLAKTFWPDRFSVFYPNNRAADYVGAALALAAIVLISWLAIRCLRSRPYIAVGWFWYLGMLVPVIGLVQVGGQAYADRYTYLPTLGVLVALVWLAGDLVARVRAARLAAVALAVLAAAFLAVRTTRQIRVWKDTRTLFTNALEVTPTDPISHQYLGDLYAREGRIDLAIPHYVAAIRIAPDFAEAHNSLGSGLGALGRYDEALEELQIAYRLAPKAHVLHNIGYTYARAGRKDEAIREYRAALDKNPDFYESRLYLGAALGERGELAESERHLRRAVELEPGKADPHRALAITLTRMGRVEEAIEQYNAILELDPGDLDALNNVAWIRATHAEARHRDGAVAVRLAEAARDRSEAPVAVLYSTLAAAYGEAGRYADADSACSRAIALAIAERDSLAVIQFRRQLARYRAGRPFHFGE